MFFGVRAALVRLHFDSADDAAHDGHRRNQRRERKPSIVRPDGHGRDAVPYLGIIVRDDYLAGAYGAAVRPLRRNRHGRQLRDVYLLVIAPCVAGRALVARRIVERDKDAYARHRGKGKVAQRAEDGRKLARRAEGFRQMSEPEKKMFVFDDGALFQSAQGFRGLLALGHVLRDGDERIDVVAAVLQGSGVDGVETIMKRKLEGDRLAFER